MLPTTLILAGMLILVMDILAIASVLMGIHGVMPKLIWIAPDRFVANRRRSDVLPH